MQGSHYVLTSSTTVRKGTEINLVSREKGMALDTLSSI